MGRRDGVVHNVCMVRKDSTVEPPNKGHFGNGSCPYLGGLPYFVLSDMKKEGKRVRGPETSC